MGLTRVAITRPIFIFMLMVAAFLLGTIAYRSMNVELNPPVNFGTITITTPFPGAGPEEVNTLVTRPIENAVSGVNGIRELTSTSREGISTVIVQLDIGMDQDVALNDVRSKIDAVLNVLPQEVDKPTVTKFDTSAQPIVYLALSATGLNNQQLRDLVDNKIQDRFAQITGVANVAVQGGDVREIRVEVKKDKLLAYGIGIADVQRALNMGTLNAPAGKVVTKDQEYSVRMKGEFKSVDQIREMIFTVSNPRNPMDKAKSVRLSDVATITDSVVEREKYSRMNGQDSVVIVLQKADDANTVQINEKAKALVAQLQEEYKPQGLVITTTLEQAKQISESLADLNFALIFGVILVAGIVYLFLHNLRGTIIVALAIPTSIFATFIALKLMGFTINNMSMLSLSLAVGVLVDDAIVVLENIYRHLRMGEDPKDAAINGRSEIGLAAIAITLADVVVFLPIGFMGGIVGQFFKPLALGFVAAVLFSLFVSFTLTPMLASRWYRKGEDMEHPTGRFALGFERLFGKLENAYRHALEWSLNHRWFVFISGNLALFAVINMLMGGSAPTLKAAFDAGFNFIPIALVIGLLVFGINYWLKIGKAARKWILVSIVAGIVLAVILASIGKLPKSILPMAGIMLGLIIASVMALVANASTKFVRSRIVLNALLFSLIFPVATMIGYGYHAWKKSPLFQFQFIPQQDSQQVSATIELPPGSSLDRTQQVVSYVENKMKEHAEVKYVVSNVGSQSVGAFGAGNTGSNYAQVAGTLYDKIAITDRLMFWKKHPEHLRSVMAESVKFDLMKTIGRVPGAVVNLSTTDAVGFGKPIQMSFISDNPELLLKTVNKIYEGLQNGAIKDVIQPELSAKQGKPELIVTPDRLRLPDANTSVGEVAAALRTLYAGNTDTKFRTDDGNEYDIRVMMDLSDRNNPETLSEVPLKFVQGHPILLSQVAETKHDTTIEKIDRRNRSQEIRIDANLLPGAAAGNVQSAIDKWLDNEHLVPEGVTKRSLGQADAQAREGVYLMSALAIGLVLVYMLLASLFDNLLYPFIIQLAQPQAVVGALLALVLSDKSLNIVGFIGLIALVGLVGKNAILLVDYANTLRERGRNRHDALVEAGPVRLRPITMTTLALVFGMLPVALAIGRGSEFRETIGITIIGGIILSTLLTLLVIPCSYTIFDDFSNWMARKLHRHQQLEKVENPPTDEGLYIPS